MCCSFWWYEIVFEVELGPFGQLEIIEIGLVGNDEFAWMGNVLPDIDTAPPKRIALVFEIMVKVCPNLGAGTYPVTFIFSPISFFI